MPNFQNGIATNKMWYLTKQNINVNVKSPTCFISRKALEPLTHWGPQNPKFKIKPVKNPVKLHSLNVLGLDVSSIDHFPYASSLTNPLTVVERTL